MEFRSLQDYIRYMEYAFALKFYSGSSVLRKGVLKIIASVIGAALYMVSLICRSVWKKTFLTTCDDADLDGYGVEYEMPHKAPTFAKGYVKVKLASGYSSASVPAGTYLIDPVTNLEYVVLLTVAVATDNLQLRVVAVSSGSEYNLSDGIELQWRDSTPTGLENTVEVVGEGGVYGGYSVPVAINGVVQQWGESADEYRERLLFRKRNPPRGGCITDYKQWAERFDFVTKAYVVPNSPEVNCVSVILANYHTQEIEVQPDDVEKVSGYILSDVRRVATADPRVFSATVADFVINASVVPFNSEVRLSVEDAVKSMLENNNPGSSIYFDDVVEYVKSNSLATSFTILSVTKNGSPVSLFSLTLDADNEIGEVARCSFNFSNGE